MAQGGSKDDSAGGRESGVREFQTLDEKCLSVAVTSLMKFPGTKPFSKEGGSPKCCVAEVRGAGTGAMVNGAC